MYALQVPYVPYTYLNWNIIAEAEWYILRYYCILYILSASRKKNLLGLGFEPESIKIRSHNVDRVATIVVDILKLKVAYVYREAGEAY